MTDVSKELAQALAIHGAGRLAEAETRYRGILEVRPDHADAHHLLGVTLHQQGRNNEAANSIRRAVELNANQWAYHSNLACALQELKAFDEAIESYRRAIDLMPQRASLWSNLGTAFHEAGRLDEAAEAFDKAIACDASSAEAHYNYANLRREQARLDEAKAHYDTAVRLKPDYSEAHSNLGNLLQDQGQLDEAVRSYQWALDARPDNAEAHYNLARALKALDRGDDALAAFDRAIELRPEHAAAHVSRGLMLLRRGDFEEGWAEYAWRWQKDDEPSLRDLPQPLWEGSSLDGKTILVYSEQGLGDEIMFGSCLPDLIESAEHCVVECEPRLVQLYKRSFPRATVHAREGWDRHRWLEQVRPIDVQTPVGNLPRYFRPSESSFPARESILRADTNRRADWRERLATLGEGPKIGISWRGQSAQESQSGRSTRLEQWAGLLSLSDMHFVNLQYGSCREEIRQVARQSEITLHDWEDLDPSEDLEGTAALISELDLVITVANSTAHLAGALGTEVWTLLSHVPSWRWMRDRADCLWYLSARLYRPGECDGWEERFARIESDLLERWGSASKDSSSSDTAIARKPIVSLPGGRAAETARSTKDIRITDRRWGLEDADLEEAFCRANELRKEKETHHAEGICREILRHAPRHAEALHLWGVIAREGDRHELAIESIEKAIAINPSKPGYYFNLATSLTARERRDEAKAALRGALELAPNFAEANLNLGAILEREGRLTEALPYCQKAVDLSPHSAHAHYNLANVLNHLGRPEESIEQYERVLEIKHDYPKAQWNLGLVRLLLCNFTQGWDGYEWREKAGEVVLDHYEVPLWDGSSLAGKRILLHAEQGVGDEIMFASCFPDVISQADRCVISCDPRLSPLFARSFPTARVHGVLRRAGDNYEPKVPEPVDYQIPIGSLPHRLRSNWNHFPRQRQYLIPHAGLRAKWRERFEQLGEGLKIGISWRAGGKAKEQRRRTTLLNFWKPLLESPGVHWVNLQYGDCAEDLRAAREQLGVVIHDWDDADPLSDLDGFAAQVSALDMVISVGNTTIHTAGSLGVEAWAILPHIPGWRYLLKEQEMPWYATVKLFRQAGIDNWSSVIEHVAGLLQDRVQSGWQAEQRPEAAEVQTVAFEGLPKLGPSRKELPELNDREEEPPHEAAKAVAADLGKIVSDDELFFRALNHHRGGDLTQAEALYSKLLDADPRHAQALHLFGALKHQQGAIPEAIDLMRRAVEQDDDQATFHYNLAGALRDGGSLDDAETHYRSAIRLDRTLAEAHLNLGVLLKNRGRFDEALACCEDALRARPQYAAAHHNMGSVLVDLGSLEAAVECYRRAIESRPDYSDAYLHVASTYRQLGQISEALSSIDRLLELRPEDADAHAQRAMLLLLRGDFASGWAEWEWRWKTGRGTPRPHLPMAPWRGTPLSGKSILVYGEQGVGDEVMFASCLPEVVDEAENCFIECDARLQPLLARSFPKATVLGRRDQFDYGRITELGPVDFQVACGTLARYLRPDADAFPKHQSYLAADSQQRLRWRAELDRLPRGLRIGISWRGGTGQDSLSRSVELTEWEPILRLAGAQFVNLQYGDCAADLAKAQSRYGVKIHEFEELDKSNDLDSVAALAAELDMVIAVPSATVHLVAAVGTDVWTLISLAPSWRWTAGRNDSLWYPAMRLFRQSERNTWADVIADVASELAGRIAADPKRLVPPPKSKALRGTREPKRTL